LWLCGIIEADIGIGTSIVTIIGTIIGTSIIAVGIVGITGRRAV
jgi:hypothetical protein